MADGRRQATLAQEPIAVGLIGQRPQQDLEREPATALQVLCLVDLAHAAPAEQALDAVASEALSGGQVGSRAVRRAARCGRHDGTRGIRIVGRRPQLAVRLRLFHLGR